MRASMTDPEQRSDQPALGDLRIEDAFVLRRVEKHRFVHVGGFGRGEGWAGLTELRLHDHDTARTAYDRNQIVEQTGGEPAHVFGPYWAQWSAFVPVDHDIMVVFGGPASGDPRDSAALQKAAASAAREIQVVSPAKRLADELEVLHAVQNLMSCEPEGARPVMQHIVDTATESLSCEFGIVWLRRNGDCAVKQRGWDPDVEASSIPAILESKVRDRVSSPVCIQDASTRSLPAPFLPSNGVRSYYLLPMGNLAVLLLVHTRHEPRGFTQLCQELGRRLAESSEVLLRAAIQRDNLSREVERASDEARRDPLTGLSNRLAWDEFLEKIVKDPPSKACAVIYLDLDDLKSVNDKYGHEAGDGRIQAMADIIRENIRPVDFAARLGGDEFAVLLPEAGEDSCAKVLDRLRAAADAHPGTQGIPIRFAAGSGVYEPGGDVRTAVSKADAGLIRNKSR